MAHYSATRMLDEAERALFAAAHKACTKIACPYLAARLRHSITAPNWLCGLLIMSLVAIHWPLRGRVLPPKLSGRVANAS